jgi:hypothetical protein
VHDNMHSLLPGCIFGYNVLLEPVEGISLFLKIASSICSFVAATHPGYTCIAFGQTILSGNKIYV